MEHIKGAGENLVNELNEIILQQKESIRQKQALIKKLKHTLFEIGRWHICHPNYVGYEEEFPEQAWNSSDASEKATAMRMANHALSLKQDDF